MSRLVLVLLAACFLGQATLTVRADSPRKLALLVGCTRYVNNSRIRSLKGPQNDVTILSKLLVARYGFAADDMRVLSGWPDAETRRPTSANIAAGFAWLIERAGPDSHVVIQLSGHGAQAPIPAAQANTRDSRNPEPDGLDELFLPADVGTWTNQGVERAIRDDQIGQWLDALEKKGAHVWIIFDCCHSGTMSRGATVDSGDTEEELSGEIPRSVGAEALGIPLESDESRGVKPSLASDVPRGASPRPPTRDSVGLDKQIDLSPANNRRPTEGQGSVVAFYAAQAFEEAPDLPRPASAPKRPEHYFGMLTYTLVQILEQSKTPLDYRELGCLLAGRYRAERGSRAPTPLFEGVLDQRVLGTPRVHSAPPLLLTRKADSLTLDAGELHGISPGSILAVLPQGDSETATPVGHVRVVSATAVTALVENTKFQDHPSTDIREWPELASCRVVERAVGSLAIKLTVAEPHATALKPFAQITRNSLMNLPRETRELFTLVDGAAASDYVFRCEVSDRNATEKPPAKPQATSPVSPAVRLYSGGAAGPFASSSRGKSSSFEARPLASYSVDPNQLDQREYREILERDVRKIFAWRNLWRVVGGLGAGAGTRGNSGLKLEVARIANENDTTGGQLLSETWVPAGQVLEVRVRNESLDDYWITLMFVAGDFSIDVWYTDAIRQGAAFPPLRSTVDDASTGPEGFVMIAQPLVQTPTRPRFDLLSQTRLGEPETGTVRAATSDPLAAFMATMTSGVASRGMAADSPGNWEARTWSWVTVSRE